MEEVDSVVNSDGGNINDVFPPLLNLHVMFGGGTPVALQWKVTLLNSRTVTL